MRLDWCIQDRNYCFSLNKKLKSDGNLDIKDITDDKKYLKTVKS